LPEIRCPESVFVEFFSFRFFVLGLFNYTKRNQEETKMKKNYFIAIAVAALMMLGTVAQPADINFSGQFRPRLNFDSDSTDKTSNTAIFDTRVRLNAKANVNANTEVFLQFQSVGDWGVDGGTDQRGTRQSLGGGGDQASDTLSDVGFHQAYLTLKNFAGQAVDLKIGRQEVVIDGHRLFGHTGWLQGAETKDAIRLSHAAGNHSLGYTYIAADNGQSMTDLNEDDEDVHIITAGTQGVLGGSLTGIFTATIDDNTTAAAWEDEMTWFTVGARQKGKLSGLDYRVEFYHQFGDAGAIANANNDMGITGVTADGGSVDRDAQLFGVRIGKTFKNASMSPTITLWYDNLSGQDDDDSSNGDWGAFDVMYDTGHKFYGFMDVFLNRTGLNTGFYGLQDIALKTKMTPAAGWTLKADLHHFRTQTDISGSDADTVVAADASLGGAMDPDLGTELDVTLAHKYDANTNIVFGVSKYWTSTTFSQLNTGLGSIANSGGGSDFNDDADWGYIMIDTKF